VLRQKIKELRKERNWTQLELAKRSGLDRGYIANLEGSKSVRRPSADAFLKLARTFNIKPEELYEAAGYIKGTNGTHPRPETPEEIIDHLKNVLPRSIPVYLDYPFHAGDGVGPTDYVYRHPKFASRNVEAYFVFGKCLEPIVDNGDIIIVDRDAGIVNGDFVACLVDNKLCVARLKKVADELWLETNTSKFKFEDCQMAAPVIEIRRRLK